MAPPRTVLRVHARNWQTPAEVAKATGCAETTAEVGLAALFKAGKAERQRKSRPGEAHCWWYEYRGVGAL